MELQLYYFIEYPVSPLVALFTFVLGCGNIFFSSAVLAWAEGGR